MAENVNHLDTVHFQEVRTAYDGYIKRFEQIVKGVDSTVKSILNEWKGEGSKAFEKDSKQVQMNLKDIVEIMYDLREALVDAEVDYVKSDAALSKSFES